MASGETKIVAAIDLGSNSFHLVVAEARDHELRVIDRIKETVRLAGGLSAEDELESATIDHAIEVLKRFAQRLKDVPKVEVRAVGTSALRQARNRRRFLTQAKAILGHPVEVIAGREEARLIYLGVAHSLADDERRRLVVDIGGGSTECIIGEHFEPLQTESLNMGCVHSSLHFFPKGRFERDAFRNAEIAARREVRTVEKRIKNLGFEVAIGSSGTINAIFDIGRALGVARSGITLETLKEIKRRMIEAGSLNDLALEGLKPDRAPVLAGGLAILRGVFEGLDIERMDVASGALREGVLYDLLGRLRHEDVRDAAVRRFAERFGVDFAQSARVERTALHLFRAVAKAWQLSEPHCRDLLVWAARLHEVGTLVAFSGYHKHSAYLVENADLPGFSTDDQQMLAALIRSHRRRLSRDNFEGVPSDLLEASLRTAVLLRLSVLLNRGRSTRPLQLLSIAAEGPRLFLCFEDGWLDHHALSRADLEEESSLLSEAGIQLIVK